MPPKKAPRQRLSTAMKTSTVTVERLEPVDKANETPDAKTKREKDEAVLTLARDRRKVGRDAWSHFHTEARQDEQFRAGTWGQKYFQWDPRIKAQRDAQLRPCLTVNKAPSFVRQVTNAALEAHLRIQVRPVDDLGDPETAEVFAGIIRNIETQSFADRAYAKASDKQAEQGLGFFTLVTEYADDGSFRQQAKIKREMRPRSILLDPEFQEADASDAEWGMKPVEYSRPAYKAKFGKEPPLEQTSFDAEERQTWFPGGGVSVCSYYSREIVETYTLHLMSDGSVAKAPEEVEALVARGLTVARTREVNRKAMIARVINATEVLSEEEWVGESVPWIPVMGDELEIDGQRDFRGVIRDSKDSARAYNVGVSALWEAIGLGNKSPVMGPKGMFGAENTEMRRQWTTANTTPYAFLEYEVLDIDSRGQVPTPQRVQFEPPVGAVIEGIKQANDDYKNTAGFRDASLGERGPQESGKAILARQQQDELGSAHYLDNLRFAIAAAGKQLIKIIRRIYDAPTVIRIIGENGKPKRVMVFAGAAQDPRQEKFLGKDATGQPIPFELPKGVKGIYDLGAGEFDIEVNASSEKGTRRQESVELLKELMQMLPPELQMPLMPLFLTMIDNPVARQMAEVAKRVSGVDDEDGDGVPDIPPKVMAQLKQLEAEKQVIGTALKQAEDVIKTKQVEMLYKAQLEEMKLQYDLIKLLVQESNENDKVYLQTEIERIGHRLDAGRARLEMREQHAQDAAQANADREFQAQQADADRAAAASQTGEMA